MTSIISPDPVRAPSESQKSALVNLLGDDDPAVYQSVRRKILSYGQTAAAWLQPYTLSGDPVLRRRTREIVTFLAGRRPTTISWRFA